MQGRNVSAKPVWCPDPLSVWQMSQTPRWGQLEESLRVIRETVAKHVDGGGVDGVLGFSQGATLASLLCTAEGAARVGWTPKYSILVTGRCSLIAPEWYQSMCEVPSLHVWGSNDKVVPGPQSDKLSRRFEGPVRVVHERGHIPPWHDDEVRRRVAGFVAAHSAG